MTQPMSPPAATQVVPPTPTVPPTSATQATVPAVAEPTKKGLGWWWLAIAVAVIAVGFLLFQLRPSDPPTTNPTPTVTVTERTTTTATRTVTTTAAQPTAAQINTADYVGQPVASAQASLARDGFTSIRTVPQASAQPAGTVLAITPAGMVALTETITLTVSSGPPTTTGTGTS
jgi:hypothetical protein